MEDTENEKNYSFVFYGFCGFYIDKANKRKSKRNKIVVFSQRRPAVCKVIRRDFGRARAFYA
jgi:hypothetical protein